jgi:glyoxylase-like metal-dependent hydrolase (beta-lactamase superfamily II)
MLRRGVGIVTGPGGTIGWLATRDGGVIVDSQFPATARVCLERLRQESAGGPLLLVNTHHHGDHTAGNGVFRPAVMQIVQHVQCAARHRTAALAAGAEALDGLADTTFTDRWSATVGDERVVAVHYGPAHTGGDALVVFERAEVVHLGDLVFNRIPPFVDRPAGASIRNWIAVLERVLDQYAGATFVFGHGTGDAVTGTVADIARFRDFLSAVLDHAQRGIAAGRSKEAVSALDTLPGFPEFRDVVKSYASPNPLFTVDHVLAVAYEELTAP